MSAKGFERCSYGWRESSFSISRGSWDQLTLVMNVVYFGDEILPSRRWLVHLAYLLFIGDFSTQLYRYDVLW